MGNIIEVRNISKRYSIGARESYGSLRDEIMQALASPFRRKARPTGEEETLWALKDVSFDVAEGEVVGIIGKNGSGKSTLLKILSRITEPTTGSITMRGRVASLLEVGTGFHPELTGRENIFLNGALLGMTGAEIRSRFDEIVAFSEIERFLDTPVKRYSSGMYVRLAFAVAAHLEPEILIVDEVLAVGDAAFQKKCLGKMGDVARGGRTVLFVSHNMGAVQTLCTRAVVLSGGKIDKVGRATEAIYHYSGLSKGRDAGALREIAGVKILTVDARSGSGGTKFSSDGPLTAIMDFYTGYDLPHCYLNLVIEDSDGRFLIHSRTDLQGLTPSFGIGSHKAAVHMPRLGLRGGVYALWFRLYVDHEGITEIADSERILVEVDDQQTGGVLNVPCRWSWDKDESLTDQAVREG